MPIKRQKHFHSRTIKQVFKIGECGVYLSP